jgi:polyphosphate kinase 2 (PPK2 family)
MLEKVNLNQKLAKKDYKRLLPDLQRRLYDLEKACWDHKIPSIVIFSGWDAAGKGSAIATLTERLDPRGFKLHKTQAPRTYEQQRPWLWRFWLKLPSHGEMAIFDLSWYERVLVERVEKIVPNKVWRRAYRDIVDFERMLADDGAVIVKLWMHITKKEQRKRFRALEKDPLESWRVTKQDWERHKKYDDYLLAAEEMFERTDTEWGSWTIVEATNRWYSRKRIYETLIETFEERLGDKVPPRYTDEERRIREAVDDIAQEGGQ